MGDFHPLFKKTERKTLLLPFSLMEVAIPSVLALHKQSVNYLNSKSEHEKTEFTENGTTEQDVNC